MIFYFQEKKLHLMSDNVRMIQHINTDTGKPFKNVNEAKKWAKKYFAKDLEFIEEKIDIENLLLLNQLNVLNIDEEEQKENNNELRIHNFDNDEIVYSKAFTSLNDLQDFDINTIQLPKGKYYFSILYLEDVFFEKNNVSFSIDNKE